MNLILFVVDVIEVLVKENKVNSYGVIELIDDLFVEGRVLYCLRLMVSIILGYCWFVVVLIYFD